MLPFSKKNKVANSDASSLVSVKSGRSLSSTSVKTPIPPTLQDTKNDGCKSNSQLTSTAKATKMALFWANNKKLIIISFIAAIPILGLTVALITQSLLNKTGKFFYIFLFFLHFFHLIKLKFCLNYFKATRKRMEYHV